MAIQRNTVQRQIVLATLQGLKTHPTIDEVYSVIHREHPSISKATVYRCLRQLADSGLVCQVSLLDDIIRYDDRTDQHYHFSCKVCGEFFDVDIGYLSEINDTVHDQYGFIVDKHDIVFKGICSKCLKQQQEEV